MSADSAFLVERVPVPDWLDALEFTEGQNLFGERAEWGFSIPWICQVLAAPRSLRPMLQAPQAGDHIGPGFVTAYPCGSRNLISSVNYTTGSTVSNAVLVPVSATGTVCFYSMVPTDIVVDLNGWFSTAATG